MILGPCVGLFAYFSSNIFDNGIGFSKKLTKELIKPYYTTKEKGSGLGLSIVNKIINDHNGAIEFNSNTTGTNIIINLISRFYSITNNRFIGIRKFDESFFT